MGIDDFRNRLSRLKDSIEQASKYSQKAGSASSEIHDFRAKKADYYRSAVEGHYNDLRRSLFRMIAEAGDQDPVLRIIGLWKELQQKRGDEKEAKKILESMENEASMLSVPNSRQVMNLRPPQLPPEIQPDVSADIKEIERCFNNGLYRSATILCGRVLETALHRKYYEATGNDILEKNPGIGLGNLIAKLKDKNVQLDPALTQQVHLINNVRVFTVHKKKEAFMPGREQAHAIILYTIDVLGRMWRG
ncbi:MAG: DUF4145 domain-containing protein [Candidatus Woesearchaeota archaeon]